MGKNRLTDQKAKTYAKLPYYCVKPSLLHINAKYACSINPSFEPKDMKSANNLKDWQDKLFRHLAELKYSIYNLYMDISESGRLHMHGSIIIKDRISFYYYDIPMLRHFCTYCIKPITSEQWSEYEQKLDDMEKWCKDRGISYTYCDMNKNEYLYPKAKIIDEISYSNKYVSFEEIDENIF